MYTTGIENFLRSCQKSSTDLNGPRGKTLDGKRRFAGRGTGLFNLALVVLGVIAGLSTASTTLQAQSIPPPIPPIVVTSMEDDTNPNDGLTTLREAINAGKSGDTIVFLDTLFSAATRTIRLKASLEIKKTLTIHGPGDRPGTRSPMLIVDGQPEPTLPPSSPNLFRILRIMPGDAPAAAVHVVITGIRFQNGRDGTGQGGGAVLVDLGASATFQDCDFVDNQTTTNGSGGALLNRGTLTVDQCLVMRDKLTGSTAVNGGGIANFGTLHLRRSLVTNNRASGLGGGLYSGGSSVVVESSTIAGNRAATSGGIAVVSDGRTASTASINASTVADNVAESQAGGLYAEGSGAVANVGGSIFTRNTLVNRSGSVSPRDLGVQKSGKINSDNYNIVVKPGTTFSPYGPNDQIGVEPQIGQLAANGGRTLTYAIASGSPAVDRGDPDFARKVPTPLSSDQRGFPFPRIWSSTSPARVDVGAFELSDTVLDQTPPVITVPADIIREATSAAGAVVTFPLPTATDAYGPVIVTTAPSSGTTFPLGPTTVVITARDAAGNSSTASFTVTVRDTTRPVIAVPANIVAEATSAAGAPVSFVPTASDFFGPVLISTTPASGSVFPLGTTPVIVTATDANNNASQATFTVKVQDTKPPVITVPKDIVAQATEPGGAKVDFVTTITDIFSTTFTATHKSGDLFPIGETTVEITATDANKNTSSASFTIKVEDTTPPVLTLPADIVTEATSALGAGVAFAATAFDAVGATITYSKAPGSIFPAGTTTVDVTASDAAKNTSTGSFTVTVTDPYGITLTNVIWPKAIALESKLTLANGKKTGLIRQKLSRPGEARWYKVKVAPGSQIEVTLTKLPANFDVVIYSDIRQAYDQLTGVFDDINSSDADKLLALLGAEFAPEAYSPEAYSPEAYSPEAYAPEAYSPEAYSPEAYSPEAYSPEAYSPEAYAPEAYSPEAYAPEAYSPEAYSPEAYSPEAYASAQQRSLVAFSASPGTVGESISLNTYSKSGEFYIRVRGQNGIFSMAAPYDLTVSILEGECKDVTDLPDVLAPTAQDISTTKGTLSPTSLILWDSTRFRTNDLKVPDLRDALRIFAEKVNGLVVDLSRFERINRLNDQADLKPNCLIAKNYVAEGIRDIIGQFRTVAPTIADITLIGNDESIPFFRTDDQALLANEANYFPPVKGSTQSETSLRYGQVLTQDRYGSSCQVVLGTGPYDLPEIPVGRLVETAGEITAYLIHYTKLFNDKAGVITPQSAFVAGYDFLADAAEAMKTDFEKGLGSPDKVKHLISPIDAAPSDPRSWTAEQLRAAFLGSRHDISYLAGHFSTYRALAADYTTRLPASEVANSGQDLLYSLILSAGCHSGYNTVDQHAISFLNDGPDWAQAFSRKGSIWIAGTGYQYGDTDFIEYTERLLLEVAQALRTGTGPVSIGRALVEAKRRYLADTPIMRGIHEKSLLQVTLYGLPMVKFDFPGERIVRTTPATEVASATSVVPGPGTAHQLHRGDLTVKSTLTKVDEVLDIVGSTSTITASYFRGSDGIVSTPGEPVRALESAHVGPPANLANGSEFLVRGIGFRGGFYEDDTGFIPFTGAPATETRGVHGIFSTPVFYPALPWSLNQIGLLCGTNGGSELNVFPTQFLSDGPLAPTGTLRRYSEMQFSTFYSPVKTSVALANPPAINVVASTVASTVVGSVIEFSIDAAATESVGVQEVWVTYTLQNYTGAPDRNTGSPGSPYYGAWQSLTLTKPTADSGIGRWQGTLQLAPGVVATQVRFIVQAVNGIGSVTHSTNFGRYFIPGTSTLSPKLGGVATTLDFVGTVPPEGAYRDTLSVQARLTETLSGVPIAGQPVRFRLGPVVRTVLTDTNGVALTPLLLDARPGAYTLQVSFGGDTKFQNAEDSRPFTIKKAPTTLTIESGPFGPADAPVIARLKAQDGTPLKERTILFLVTTTITGTTTPKTTGRAEITDGAGQVALSLGAGSHTVKAYFAQEVLLPDGTTLTNGTPVLLTDPLYTGSKAEASITLLSNWLQFGDLQAWVNYSDSTADGATASNAGVSKAEVLGDIAGSSNRNSILAGSSRVTAYLQASLSGESIAKGSVSLRVQGSGNTRWRGDAILEGTRVEVNVDWDGSGGTGKYHVWMYPAAGSGPLYNATPALLSFQLIFGTGPSAQGGAAEVGGADKPWTQQNGNSRVRSN